MAPSIATRILVLSDTHGDAPDLAGAGPADVAIHCGDLTEESTLGEMRGAVELLRRVRAPLKLVIPGNHDFTLDVPGFEKKLREIEPPLDDELVRRHYGDFGAARALFAEARAAGVVYLDEGIHRFVLANQARLTVYASPYTPSTNEGGFQYHPQEERGRLWTTDTAVDIFITHGPPQGILDYTARQRAGSSSLFQAVARARPLMHCFGHIHEGWGARNVTWKEETGEEPSHFTAIDNDRSHTIESLAGITAKKFDTGEIIDEKARKWEEYRRSGYCTAKCAADRGRQTLFVNAAIQGTDDDSAHFPWVIEVELQAAERAEDRALVGSGDYPE